MDRVRGCHRAAVLLERLAGIGVHIEAREVAAADVHAQAVAFFEDVAGGVEFDREGIDLAGFHELFFLQRIAEAGANDAVGEIEIKTVRPVGAGWIYVDELGGEVGVQGIG